MTTPGSPHTRRQGRRIWIGPKRGPSGSPPQPSLQPSLLIGFIIPIFFLTLIPPLPPSLPPPFLTHRAAPKGELGKTLVSKTAACSWFSASTARHFSGYMVALGTSRRPEKQLPGSSFAILPEVLPLCGHPSPSPFSFLSSLDTMPLPIPSEFLPPSAHDFLWRAWVILRDACTGAHEWHHHNNATAAGSWRPDAAATPAQAFKVERPHGGAVSGPEAHRKQATAMGPTASGERERRSFKIERSARCQKSGPRSSRQEATVGVGTGSGRARHLFPGRSPHFPILRRVLAS